jgi:hypothetical protein
VELQLSPQLREQLILLARPGIFFFLDLFEKLVDFAMVLRQYAKYVHGADLCFI